jgi:hypothetical protein
MKVKKKTIIKRWTPGFDMSTVPEDVFNSEKARRNAGKRKSYSGGVAWNTHRPDYSRCRCAMCMATRELRRAEKAKLPKRPPGRPRKEAA